MDKKTISLKIVGKSYDVGVPTERDYVEISEMKNYLMQLPVSSEIREIADLVSTVVSVFETMIPALKADLELQWLGALPLPKLLELSVIYLHQYKPFYDALVEENNRLDGVSQTSKEKLLALPKSFARAIASYRRLGLTS
jgi:hypothetical protein